MSPPSSGGGGSQSGAALEVEQGDVDDGEVEGDVEGGEPERHVGLEEDVDPARDGEQADGVVQRGLEELADAELAVGVGVVPEERDRQPDPALDADLDDDGAHLGAGRDLPVERHDGDRLAVLGRVEEQALEDDVAHRRDVERLVVLSPLDGLADAVGVEAGHEAQGDRCRPWRVTKTGGGA